MSASAGEDITREADLETMMSRLGLLFAMMAVAFVAPHATTAASVSFATVDEIVSDTPIKTQISQHVVVSGVPTRSELEAEILRRYRSALGRSGFRYHNPPTNIYIYVYGSEAQAKDGSGGWIGMLAKSYGDQGEPAVTINDDRLAALSKGPETRVGLSEAQRKQIFRELGNAEYRATQEAMARVPDSRIQEQINLERSLTEKYRDQVIRKHGLTPNQVSEITVEGATLGWPLQ